MTDRFAPRSGDDYAAALAGNLPTGAAWPRDEDSALMAVVDGLGQLWGDLDGLSANFLQVEADPRTTLQMLPDWERAFGLPDECVAEPLTIDDRRTALLNRITLLGLQSRAFFIGLAASIGYSITITEYSPFMAGVSRCGDTRSLAPPDPKNSGYRWQVGPPEMRFCWKINVYGRRLTWFRAGSGQCGVDPMLRIALATDLECLLRRNKPAHTELVFDYGDIGPGWIEYVWFRAGESHVGVDPMCNSVSHDEG